MESVMNKTLPQVLCVEAMLVSVFALSGCAGVNVGFGVGIPGIGVNVGVGADGNASVGVGGGGRVGNVGVGGSVNVPIGKVGDKEQKNEPPPDTDGASKRP
jgi:hypothetical protein